MNYWYILTDLINSLIDCFILFDFSQIHIMHRKLWQAFKILAPVTPYIFLKNSKLAEEEQENRSAEFETHINKIFLTPDISQFTDLKIFAFDAQILGKQVVTHLDTTLGRHITNRFNDGQVGIQVLDSVQGHDVFIIKSFENKDINDGIMELILAIAAMKRSGAQKITAIIPFIPYTTMSSAVDDGINEGFDFHTCFAADIIKMLQNIGCDEVITLNSTMSCPKGFTDKTTFINIDATELVVPFLIRKQLQKPVIVASQGTEHYMLNIHQLKRSFKLFGLNSELGFFNNSDYIGEDVRGRDVVLYNNLVRTGNSTKYHVKALKQLGARRIYCFGFHGLCSNDLFEDLIKSLPIEELIMTNTIFHGIQNKKIRVISVAKLLAEIISIMHQQKSLSDYRGERQMLKYAYLQKIKSLNSMDYIENQGYIRMDEL